MCECEQTVLVVENKPSTLKMRTDRLRREGYKVFTAANPDEAMAQAEKEIIHVAVIDVRLKDDSDQDDDSGLKLAAKLPDSIRKVITTAQDWDNLWSLIERIYERNKQGHTLATAFVHDKRFVHGRDYWPDKIVEEVRKCFQHDMPINSSLKISMERNLSWETIVNQIKIFNSNGSRKLQKAAARKRRETGIQVLKDLTCRLFSAPENPVSTPDKPHVDAVRFLSTMPGYSPCTVVVVRPSFRGSKGIELAVKFGPQKSIQQELSNYVDFVKPFIPDSTRLEYPAAWSHNMGALVYTFVGGNVKSVETLRDYYHNPNVSDSDFCKTLEYLFQSCEKWYESRNSDEPSSAKHLDVLYREQLNLSKETQVKKLRQDLLKLIKDGSRVKKIFKLTKKKELHVNLGESKIVLPDPIAFCLEKRVQPKDGRGAKGEKTSHYPFPIPSQMAMTHGDLHANNVIVKNGHTWLIDFYKTGVGHALRDFAELESDIKFTLFNTKSLNARYQLESALLAARKLDETLVLEKASPQQLRALTAIQRLREMACELTDIREAREYYMALLFYALKGISGFTSPSGAASKYTDARIHALLSAALICHKLKIQNPDKRGTIFLAHDYRQRYSDVMHSQLQNFIKKLNYEAAHPLDTTGKRQIWGNVADIIEEADVGFYEITTRSGNVYFELGYALGMQKPYFAFIEYARLSHANQPSLLSGEFLHAYKSTNDLKKQVKQIIDTQKSWMNSFAFRPAQRERKSKQVRARKGSGWLLIPNTKRQQKEFAPALKRAVEKQGWKVEVVHLEREVNIESFYLEMLKVELVVGCLSSDRARGARQANAEVALALGIAQGLKKEPIILQEEKCKVLTDLKPLTITFRGVRGAVEILTSELMKRFPRRGAKLKIKR